jgi:ribosomal protein S18 acetylase RimI-like enzyme
MNSQLFIRTFEAHDQTEVQKLILAGLEDHFGYIDHTFNPDLEDIMTCYIQAGNIFFVAQIAKQIVGTGAIIKEDSHNKIGRIVRLSVHREFRRKGIGTSITKRLIEEARKKGFKSLVLETNLDWFAAINLYKQAGFID